MFLEALFTAVKIWKQSKCPSVYRWIKKCGLCIQNGILLSHKNEIMPFATAWVDLEDVILTEIIQRKTLYVITHRRNLKPETNGYNKAETDCQIQGANQ